MSEINNRHEILVGDRIKQIRMSKGMTQKQFADSLGIVQGFLSGIERGKKVPSDTLLIALCHLYGISREWLLSGAGDMSKSPTFVSGSRREVAIPLLKHIPTEFPDKINDEDIAGYVSLPNMPEDCFSVINYGNFMAPTVRDGDLVIFQPGGEIRNRDIVLVHNRWGETILRRYRLKSNELFLAPDNPSYAPFKPDPNTRIVGKVVDVWRKVQL